MSDKTPPAVAIHEAEERFYLQDGDDLAWFDRREDALEYRDSLIYEAGKVEGARLMQEAVVNGLSAHAKHYTGKKNEALAAKDRKAARDFETTRRYDAQVEALTAENERLRKAFREIEADCEAEYPPSHGAIKYACRAALAGKAER